MPMLQENIQTRVKHVRDPRLVCYGSGMALGSRNRKGGISSLSDVLGKAYPAPAELAGARVMAAWSDVVPERVLDAARAVRFSRGTLTVHTKSSAWANELMMMMPGFLAAMRKKLPGTQIVPIHFQVGPLPERSLRGRATATAPTRLALDELPEEVGRALATIRDDELRTVVHEAAQLGMAKEKRRRQNEPR